ncbi:hypothetical protein [Streptomyces sp. NPDC054765]
MSDSRSGTSTETPHSSAHLHFAEATRTRVPAGRGRLAHTTVRVRDEHERTA